MVDKMQTIPENTEIKIKDILLEDRFLIFGYERDNAESREFLMIMFFNSITFILSLGTLIYLLYVK